MHEGELKEAVLDKPISFDELRKRKENTDMRHGVERLQVRLTKAEDYYAKLLADGDDGWIHLGDHNNRSIDPVKDLVLNMIIESFDFRVNGNHLSLSMIRDQADASTEEHPKINSVSSTASSRMTFDFYAREKSYFNVSIYNATDEERQKAVSDINGLPFYQWQRKLGERVAAISELELEGDSLEIGIKEMEGLPEDDPNLRAFIFEHLSDSCLDYQTKDIDYKKSIRVVDDEERTVSLVPANRRDVFMRIEQDKSNGNLSVSLVLDLDGMRGKHDERQFIKSKTAKDVWEFLGKYGIELNGIFMNAVTEGSMGRGHFSSRYGNGYTEMTSKLSDYIGGERGKRQVRHLFDVYDPQQLKALVDSDKSGLNEPSRLIIDMLCDLISPKKDMDIKEFVRWESNLSKRGDGACEDGEYYLIEERKEGETEEDDDFLYYYQHGGRDDETRNGFYVAMTKNSILVDGVELPKGFFVRVSKRGEVQPIRASMFCFDPDDSKDAFGVQYDKAEKESNGFGYYIDRIRQDVLDINDEMTV